MAIPSSGQISLTDIQAEFGGSNPAGLSEYYKGGTYVDFNDFAPNVPTSGPISLSDFYGAQRVNLICNTYTSDINVTLPSTLTGQLMIVALGGGGGGGGNDAGTPGYPGYAGKIVTANVAANPGDVVSIYIGGGGGGGADGAIATPGYGGSSSAGYYGGTGGASGGSGTSGSGGGGGAATVLMVSGVLQLAAAGGGGGGGAGNGPAGKPNNNNPGTNGTIYGGGGQPKGGDGGGGGGGGGGANSSSTVVSPNRPVYPGTYPVYNGFLNTYGVWISPDFVNPVNVWQIINYTITVSASGNYYFVASADNAINVFVNNSLIVSNGDWHYSNTSGAIYLDAGDLTINIQAINYQGPALFAAALYQSGTNAMIWNTRQTTAPGGGGLGGATAGGDSGAYSGENGTSLVPAGGGVTTGSNGGGSSNQPGTGGYLTLCYYA